MTIEQNIIVDLDSLFEFGSFYTAISRGRSLEKLYLLDIHKEYEFNVDLRTDIFSVWFLDLLF